MFISTAFRILASFFRTLFFTMSRLLLNSIDATFDTSLQMDLGIPGPPFEQKETQKPKEGSNIFRLPTIKKKDRDQAPSMGLPSIERKVSDPVSSLDSDLSTDGYHNSFQTRTSSHKSGSSSWNLSLLDLKRAKTSIRESYSSSQAKKTLVLPPYCPPTFICLSFYQHVNSSWLSGSSSSTPLYIAKRPSIPQCRTNTNMATYTHRLYVYEQYMKYKGESSDSSVDLSVTSLLLAHEASIKY